MSKFKRDSPTQENEEDFFRDLKRHEQGFIGAIFRENSLMSRALEHIAADSFQFKIHRLIFATMTELYKHQQNVSTENVVAALRSRAELNEAGGESYIAALERNVPVVLTIEQHDYVTRFVMMAAAKAIQAAAFEEREIEEILGLVTEKLEDIKELKGSPPPVLPTGNADSSN
jgi:replicative DNA helicase